MRTGLIAKKMGMTARFLQNGTRIPCTVLHIPNNIVLEKKAYTNKTSCLVGTAFSLKSEARANKARKGYFSKLGTSFCDVVKEFEVDSNFQVPLLSSLGVSHYAVGQKVDVISLKSKGKGFSGEIKRHNFKSQRASHGVSLVHNHAGSTGQCQDPGRVFPGKKMAGQYGASRKTLQSLEVLFVDVEKSLIYIKGSVPGPSNAIVFIQDAVKFSSRQPVELPSYSAQEGAS